ncbi:glutathionyl-hydroquinone reductase [Malassezia caprae]|uniref:Glutathionyl-hydroquinone reductase n=1 Tax=Malassezia caprae TaxID=1381934 RepID=A0AAF0E3P2_9BASI|nr:glutathionyl-hydroquinone reductase [Malassezia caprae]
MFGATSGGQGASNSAFPRSFSFSATTDTKPSFSFGSTSNAAPAQNQTGGLFGSMAPGNNSTTANNASQPATTGMFGNQNAQANNSLSAPSASQPSAPGGGLFGNQNTNAAGGKGLFGAQITNSTNTGGMFGAQNNTAGGGSTLFGGQSGTSNNTGGGLFGAQNNNAGGGLFGNSSTNTGTGGGIFGSQAQKPATGGLFGSQSTTSNAGGTGLFGTQSNTNTLGSVGFAGQNPSNTNSLWGAKPAGVSFGNAAPQSVSPIMQHPYYQRERYNELPDAQRTLLDTMDKFISSQTQIKYELRARDASEEMHRLMADVHALMSAQQSLSATLEADTMRLQSVTAKVEKDRHDNAMLHQVATHAKEKLSDGSSFLDWLRRFYENISEEDITRIQRYRLTMEQLERHLISIDQREQFAPQVISDVIRNQNASFMAMAEQVATLHAEIETLKKDYIKWYQTRFQSVRDPFAPVAAAADRT